MAKLIMTVEEMKDRQKWLDLRNKGLGGSDAAAIMGKSPWKSRLALWAEKTGEMEPEDLSDNQRVYWGMKLEDDVAEWFSEVTGKQIRRRGMMQSCEHEWMLASLDREVIGEKAGLEVKTADISQRKNWGEDEVPDPYYLQCQWYLAVTGYDRWYLAVLIGGNDARWYQIDRNQAQIDALVRAGEEFWKMVQDRVAPEPDGSESAKDALDAQYPGGQKEPVDVEDQEAVNALNAYLMVHEQLAKLKRQEDELKQIIMVAMGNNEEARISGIKVTWRQQAGKSYIDMDRLREDHADIYRQYLKEGKPFRNFRVWNKMKKER